MVWWAVLAIQAGFQLLSGLLQKVSKPKPEEKPKLPVTSGSQPIPVAYGRCLITAPQVLDYLDFKVEPIKKRNPGTFFLTSITLGYRYYLGIIFGLGYAAGDQISINNPALVSVYIDNQEVFHDILPTHPPPGYIDFDIDKPSLFGSPQQEGGVQARVRFYDGSDPDGLLGNIKESDPYWEQERAITLPHYKNLCYAVWHGPSSGYEVSGRTSGYIGNTTSLWPISFLIQRYPDQLAPFSGIESIGDHANPIFCLYELMTNADYGAGIDSSEFDIDEWAETAFVAHANGLAFSYLWSTESPVEDMAGEILRHTGAVMWTDLQSGLIRCRIVSEESVDSLPTYGNADFLEVPSFTRGSWEDTYNQVKVVFTDHAKTDHGDSTYTYNELANFDIQGQTKTETINYPGCPSVELASQLADREARLLCRPVARLTGKLDRQGWLLRPGSRFFYEKPEDGIGNLLMRVTNVKLGTLAEGAIEISAIEEVFTVGLEASSVPGPTHWTDPLGGNAADALAALSEIPYFMQRDDFIRLFSVARKPSSSHVSYDGAINGTTEESEIDFTPYGLLVNTLPQLANGDYDTTGFAVDTLTDGDLVDAGTSTTIAGEGVSLAILGDPAGNHEWIAFESVSGTTTLTLDNVWRGLLDTPPREWPADTPVWFFHEGSGTYPTTRANGNLYELNALTRTMRNQLLAGSATDYSYVTLRRALRPLPPYYIRLNGSYTNEIWTSGDLVFTWREHDRLAVTQIFKQSAATEASEDGVAYLVEVYGDAMLLANTYTSITSPWTYTAADQTSDFGSPQDVLSFWFFAERAGVRSRFPWIRKVYGFDATGDVVTVEGVTVTVGGELVVVS